MYSRSTLLALISSSLASAMPGYSPWSTPAAPVPVQPVCATTYSTSYYTLTNTIPIIESKTIWVPTTQTSTSIATKTSLYTSETVLTTAIPSSYVTSWPVTSWVTSVVDTVETVYETEACTVTSIYTTDICVTVPTAYASVVLSTEYETSCATSSTVVAGTTCSTSTAWAAPTSW